MGINSFPPSSGGEISSYKAGNTASRPSAVGSTFFDTTTNQLLIKTNTGWNVVVDPILPPTSITATEAASGVSVAFTAPSWSGTITGYKVTSSSGVTASGSSSPIVVPETISGTYTYTVQSISATGASIASASTSGTYTAFTATGGTITSDSTYTYNTFTSSGTWTPNKSGKAFDAYVVAGGRGTGNTTGNPGNSSFNGTTANAYPNSGYLNGGNATANRNGTTGTYISWTPIQAYVGSSGGAGGTPYNGSGNYSGGNGGSGAGNGGTYNGSNATNATTYGSGGGGAQSTTTSNWGNDGGFGGQVATTNGTSTANSGLTVEVGAGSNGTNNDSGKLGGNGMPGVVIIRYLK